ncbi:unnamed protein product [Lymnaea stagnalis]|uniref:Receptor ligand binding region domain-containing protein n=1 Tax=Lymnaea stagnalis TaxID=6523 RepID=A0AAV2I1W9_LYMST
MQLLPIFFFLQVSVFIGPTCDYSVAPVARYAPRWHIPVISPGAFAHDMSDKQAEYSTLTRIGTTFNSLAYFVITKVMGAFHWRRLQFIFDSNGHSSVMPRFCYLASSSFINRAKANRFNHVVSMFSVDDLNIDQVLRNGTKNEFASE